VYLFYSPPVDKKNLARTQKKRLEGGVDLAHPARTNLPFFIPDVPSTNAGQSGEGERLRKKRSLMPPPWVGPSVSCADVGNKI